MAIKSPSAWQELTPTRYAGNHPGRHSGWQAARRKQRPFSGHRPRRQARRTMDSPSDRVKIVAVE